MYNSDGGMFIVGEAVHVWGRRVYEKFQYFLLNFSVNLKVLYKVYFLKKQEWMCALFQIAAVQPVLTTNRETLAEKQNN